MLTGNISGQKLSTKTTRFNVKMISKFLVSFTSCVFFFTWQADLFDRCTLLHDHWEFDGSCVWLARLCRVNKSSRQESRFMSVSLKDAPFLQTDSNSFTKQIFCFGAGWKEGCMCDGLRKPSSHNGSLWKTGSVICGISLCACLVYIYWCRYNISVEGGAYRTALWQSAVSQCWMQCPNIGQ